MKQSSPQIQHKPRLAIFNFFVLSILLFANYSGLSAQGNLKFKVQQGKQISSRLSLSNKCEEAQFYRLTGAKSLRFATPTDKILISGHSTVNIGFVFDATGLEPNVYTERVSLIKLNPRIEKPPGNINGVNCNTVDCELIPMCKGLCKKEPVCDPPTSEFTIELTVTKPPQTPTPSPTARPTVFATGSFQPTPTPDPNYLPIIFAVTVTVFVAAIIAKNLFEKWKYGNNFANLGSLKKAKAAKEKLTKDWLKKRKSKNIHAIGVGKINGTENYCIQVFVENADGQMLENPPVQLLPAEFRKFPIFIFEMPRAQFLSENYGNKAKDPHETIIGGISGANTNLSGETGTIGYFCSSTILRPIRKFRKEIYLLSNTHVFADLSKTEKTTNDLIQQPSPGENKRHDFIASLENFVPIKFDNDTEDPNFADAAIAKLFPGKTHKLEIPNIGKITDFVPREKIELRTKCRKFGRTTGYTEGQIFSIHLSIWVKYGATNQESFFKEQFLIVPTAPYDDFLRGGDSGSLLADHENKALGLIFAGAASNTNFGLENLPTDLEDLIPNSAEKIRSFGVATPISVVMKSLNVKLMI